MTTTSRLYDPKLGAAVTETAQGLLRNMAATLAQDIPGVGFGRLNIERGGHYKIVRNIDDADPGCSGELLREQFPTLNTVNEMNFVLFSTSGVHGSFCTIEEIEENLRGENIEQLSYLTYLIVQPRLVCLRYGRMLVTLEDIPWLKSLRARSLKVVSEIGL